MKNREEAWTKIIFGCNVPTWANWKSIDKTGCVYYWENKPVVIGDCFHYGDDLGHGEKSKCNSPLSKKGLEGWPEGALKRLVK